VVGGIVLQCFASVFVSGMFIATKHATRRNAFILMLSLALGIGVAMEPNLFEGGGVASFHGKNLRHNTGFWPRYKTCKTFPVVDGAQVRTCTNDNGACCSEYDKGEDSNRTTAIILLKTPYAIGFVVALFLHLLLPEDKEEEEEEDSGKEMKVDPVEA
jgi:xanthine/uracil permease